MNSLGSLSTKTSAALRKLAKDPAAKLPKRQASTELLHKAKKPAVRMAGQDGDTEMKDMEEVEDQLAEFDAFTTQHTDFAKMSRNKAEFAPDQIRDIRELMTLPASLPELLKFCQLLSAQAKCDKQLRDALLQEAGDLAEDANETYRLLAEKTGKTPPDFTGPTHMYSHMAKVSDVYNQVVKDAETILINRMVMLLIQLDEAKDSGHLDIEKLKMELNDECPAYNIDFKGLMAKVREIEQLKMLADDKEEVDDLDDGDENENDEDRNDENPGGGGNREQLKGGFALDDD